MLVRLSHLAEYVESSAASASLFAEQTGHDLVRYRFPPSSLPGQPENIAFEFDLQIAVFDEAFVVLFELIEFVGHLLLLMIARAALRTLGIVTPARPLHPVIPSR
jgi:hypothetical protein